MADIRTSISVQDGLSKAFMTMTQSIEQTNQAFEQIQLNLGRGVTSSGIDKATSSQNRLNNELEEGDSIAKKFRSTLVSVGTAIAGYMGVSKVLSVSDEMTQTVARLNLVNDGMQTTKELQQMIYESAQRTGNAYNDTANIVAGLGQRAGEAFSSNAEAIVFAETLNKMFGIAGASQAEVSSASLQLTQALGSGVLRGEELNAVFESAPNVIQAIADSLDVSIGKIREMAADGEITAQVVKNALLGATEEVNKQFESMPFTSGALWTRFKNAATFAFEGVLTSINNTLNGERFTEFINISINALYSIAAVATTVYNTVSAVGAFLYDNWAFVSPILIGVGTALGLLAARAAIMAAATHGMAAAQWVYNAALAASPLTWVILAIGAIIAIIYAAIAAYNHFAGTTISATGAILGALTVAAAIVGNLFVGLYNGVLDVVSGVYNIFATLAEFFVNVFNDPLGSALRVFVGFANSAIDIVKSVASAVDAIFGSDLGGTLGKFQTRINNAANEKFGEVENPIARFDASKYQLERYDYGNAYNAGYDLGAKFKIGGLGGPPDVMANPGDALLSQLAGINNGIGEVKENTGRTADAVEVSKEDLKYLRDSAVQSAINRFTTASISVDMKNNNTINSGLDLDGIVDQLAVGVEEAMNTIAVGV